MITKEQLKHYSSKGYLILPKMYQGEVLASLITATERLEKLDGPEFFREKNSGKIRTVFAPEKFDQTIAKLINQLELRQIIYQILGEDFYLFQSKLNTKACLESGVWTWHQDFKFWKEDGMLQANAVTAAVLLSDVDIANGPILLIPGTHQEGEVSSYLNNPEGVHDENLKYMIHPSTLSSMCEKYEPIVPLLGKAGDLLLFHSNVLHASYQNMGYLDRKLLMLTFNPIRNIQEVEHPRPDYMVKRNKAVLSPNS
ncbi:phytanoyl-CoA dioxygenase family protein [Algoriphagus halophytocola]|uniref:Phytanoyl-CoA dioxygenase family protein n=1 Tax=Algoriphagus halophytocola TaxID=2991499 RepID=A0ABY6MI65_9BACT|nr:MULTISPECIES: phytanoyl-CoA dioxygenase family protein [unclassified Algoriphagus]UZD23483.1 phytanoyl-CoA dioxygenase family protein [Algoriphagus sp. TR-M5]WBL44777.1 phytanoyl-CoA dioxygenase family protein [Algoriphagus sp. TR-M9]